MIDFIKLIRENINTVLIAIMLIWVFSISIEIRQLKVSMEEMMFELIYKLKQMEANDEDTE